MSPSTVGMAAPFRWLRKAIDVGRRNPKALFGAIALMIVVVMAITMAQMFLQVLAQGSMTGLMVVMGLMTAVNWVVMPPLVGGLFRVVDATDRGLPVVASDVFNAYGRGQGGKRLILVSLVYSLAYVGFAALMLLTPLGQFFREYFAIALATPVGGEPDMAALQALFSKTTPATFLWLPVVAIVMFTWLHASMLALATAALREVDVATAVVAGALAALRLRDNWGSQGLRISGVVTSSMTSSAPRPSATACATRTPWPRRVGRHCFPSGCAVWCLMASACFRSTMHDRRRSTCSTPARFA